MNILLFSRHKVSELNINAQSHIRVNMLFTYILPFAWVAAVVWHNPDDKNQTPRAFVPRIFYIRSEMHATSLPANLQIFCDSLFFIMFYLRNRINKPITVILSNHLFAFGAWLWGSMIHGVSSKDAHSLPRCPGIIADAESLVMNWIISRTVNSTHKIFRAECENRCWSATSAYGFLFLWFLLGLTAGC